MDDKKLTPLPLAGAQLIKLRFCGNSKDSDVTIETVGNRKAIIELNAARLDLSLSGQVRIACKGWGDSAVVWEIAPTPDQRITIEDAAIEDFPGTDEEWEEALRDLERTGTFIWGVDLRLKLTATERKADGPGTAGGS